MNTLHTAEEGFLRSFFNVERQVAGSPSSWAEERQNLTTERDNEIALAATLKSELDGSFSERDRIEERIVELTREMRRSRRFRLDMNNTANTERGRRELNEVNNELIREERNTARAYLTRMTNDLQTITT